MVKVKLGKTGIEVSKLGIGTGTAHPSGHCAQALMSKEALSKLLLFAFDHGINFWDTAFQYKTYHHIRQALKQVRRSDIVLTTKLTTASQKGTIKRFYDSLEMLDIDYIDVCLIHGVRTKREFETRLDAFNALLKLRTEGRIRAIGFSSHGLSALKHAVDVPEIDVIWARINHAGLHMDPSHLGLYDLCASLPLLKKYVDLLPRKLLSYIRPASGLSPISEENRKEVENTLKKIHTQRKGAVGMKVLAEGQLRMEVTKTIKYVKNLNFIDAFIVGMLSEQEIKENCGLMESD